MVACVGDHELIAELSARWHSISTEQALDEGEYRSRHHAKLRAPYHNHLLRVALHRERRHVLDELVVRHIISDDSRKRERHEVICLKLNLTHHPRRAVGAHLTAERLAARADRALREAWREGVIDEHTSAAHARVAYADRVAERVTWFKLPTVEVAHELSGA